MLSARDRQRLIDVHPDLVRVVEAASASVAFMVVEGSRSFDRQKELFRLGKSKTMNSRHLPKAAKGVAALVSHAVDLAPLVDLDGDGDIELSWDAKHFYPIAEAMQAAADAAGVPIVWGGSWRSFVDMPHFELDRKVYP